MLAKHFSNKSRETINLFLSLLLNYLKTMGIIELITTTLKSFILK